jgi:signal transduction histidine kinase
MTVITIVGLIALIGLTGASVYGYLQNSPDAATVSIHRYGYTPIQIIRDVTVAWAFIGAGLIAWYRRPQSRVGLLMIGVGAAWLLNGFEYLPTSPWTSLGIWLGTGAGLVGIILGILILSYPSGTFRAPSVRAWVGLSGVYAAALLAAMLMSPARQGNCECRSAFIVRYDEPLLVDIVNIADLWFAGMALFLIGALVWRWRSSSPPARRALAPLWIAGAVIMFVAVTGESFWSLAVTAGYFEPRIPSLGGLVWGGRSPTVWNVLPWVQALSLLLVPVALLWGLLRLRLRQSAVAALAVELGRTGGSTSLVGAMRRALADQSLEVLFWSRPAGEYVTQAGEGATLPTDTAHRSVTKLTSDDGPLAALIHDPALDDQRSLVDGVAAVGRLAIENERLHAEVKAQLEEVRASRERIVRAADDERRRVERNLHDGAQQRLVSLSLALTMAQAQLKAASPEARATLAEAETELKLAIGELRELARGLHPAILGEAGLTPALEALAERSPVPVSFRCTLSQRLSPLVEATAYFVAAEALTNVAKYASASSVELSAVESEGWLHLTVADDGVGGADPVGTGLRGLFDRVAAVGGRLSIDSLSGRGTRLVADIPCA